MKCHLGICRSRHTEFLKFANYKKAMTFSTKPPTGVEPLIAPGCNPGMYGDFEIQCNPKGVEHPRMKQTMSLVM